MADDGPLKAARLPPSEALAFLRQKLNVPTRHWDDLWQQAHARGFMVAGAASTALLADFRKAVDGAIAGELTIKTFRKEFDAIVAKHGWVHHGAPGWRSDLIYTVNMAMAHSAGRYARMTTPEALEMFPYWEYVHNTCQHPRPQHVAWSGTILRADDPWWNTHFPPNGWRCHCEVRVISERMLRQSGRTLSRPPPINALPWRNKRTGEVLYVPEGIDPGFAYNPGKAWKNGQAAHIGPVPAAEDAGSPHAPAPHPAAPEPTAIRPGATPLHDVPDVHRDRARQESILRLRDHPVGNVEAGVVPDAVRQALGSDTGSVRLSGETMEKQIEKHGDLSEADYRLVPQVLAGPHVVARQDDRRLLLFHHDGQLYRAALKATADGSENYLLSFHRTTKEKARKALRNLPILSGDLDALPDDADADTED